MPRKRNPAVAGGIDVARLRATVERIERLEEERKATGDDIKAVYAEAKSAGFDTKALRQVVRDRRANSKKLQDFEAALSVYRSALGVLADTPLGEAAIGAVSISLHGAAPSGSA